METSFSKYQATGNDFILFDGIKSDITLSQEQIKEICDRNFGIGADGLIIVREAVKAPFYMDYYNSDGSESEMCGNGIRCMAAFVIDNNVIASKAKQSPEIATSPTAPRNDIILIETRVGIKAVELVDQQFAVDMGEPSFSNQAIGFKDKPKMWKYNLEVGDRQIETYGVSMGNPHCVIFSENLKAESVRQLGLAIENHPLFEKRINVEWVKVKSEGELEVRVWERGAGLTLSCGTGACAAFAVANRLGLVGKQAEVSLPGGQVKVELQNNHLILKGEAKFVFKGSIEIDK